MPADPADPAPVPRATRRVVGVGFQAQVHALVAQLPAGFVTTYGDIAGALGSRSVARHVGFAMAALPAGSTVPWWRVVAAGGRLATASETTQRRQARLLAAEGIVVRNARVQAFANHRFPIDALGPLSPLAEQSASPRVQRGSGGGVKKRS